MSAIRPPILLIHGIDDTAEIFCSLKAYLSDRGWHDVHTLDLQPNNGDIGLDLLAAQVQEYVDQNLSAAPQIDVVGFSMGGIVGRYYLQRLGGIQRVRRFVTLSSPHNGTWTGYYGAMRESQSAGLAHRPIMALGQAICAPTQEQSKCGLTAIF